MAFKKLHLAVAVVGIAAIGTAAWWFQNKGSLIPASLAGIRPVSYTHLTLPTKA